MQKSADFCKWWEFWITHINSNMFLPYHAKNQPHFQVSERTYSHFIEIRKDAKISWFLQMMGNLKTSYKFKYVFPYHAKNNHHFHVSERIYSHFIKIGKFCKFVKISWLLARGDMHWPQQQSTLALTRAYQIFQKYGVRRYFRIGGQNWVVLAES